MFLKQLPERKMFPSQVRKKIKDLKKIRYNLEQQGNHDKETEKIIQSEFKNLKRKI